MSGSRRLAALRSWLRRNRPLVAAAVGCGVYFAWVLALPKPITVTTVSVAVERIEFAVHDPRLAAIPIFGMRVSHREEVECASGLLRPDPSAVIAYERAGNAPLTISVEHGGAVYEPRHGRPSERVSAPYILVASEECGSANDRPHRLPIWGDLRIGVEMRPATAGGNVTPGLLLEGKLRVQVRSVDSWLVAGQPATLYAGPEIELAAGARIEAQGNPREQTWFGFARIENDPGGLRVLASTEAPHILVFRPGRTDADVIRITGLTQMFEDPNVVRLQLLALGVIAIVGLVANFIALAGRG